MKYHVATFYQVAHEWLISDAANREFYPGFFKLVPDDPFLVVHCRDLVPARGQAFHKVAPVNPVPPVTNILILLPFSMASHSCMFLEK